MALCSIFAHAVQVRQSLSSSLSITNLPMPSDARPKLPPPPPPPAARAAELSAAPLNPTPAAVQSKKRDMDAREPPAVAVSEQDTSQSAFSSHRRSGSGLDGKQGGKSAFSTQKSSVVLNAPPTALPDVVGLGDNLEREMGSDDDDLVGLSDAGGPVPEPDGAFVLDTKRRDLELEIKAMQSWLQQKDGDTEESEQLKANLEAKHAELNALRKPAPLEPNNPVRSVMKRAVHSRRQRRLGSSGAIPIIDFESLEPVHPVTTEREGVVPADGGALSGGEYTSSAISKPVPKVQLLKLRKSIVSSNHFQESGRNKSSQASLIDIIASDNFTADELLDMLQQEDCSNRHVAVPAVHMLLQHVREQLMSEVGETLHSRELLIQQQAMLSAQEHFSAAIEDMREKQALELQEMQSKLSQSYDDHVAAIAELSIARTTLESLRDESAFAQRQQAEVVASLRTQLEEAVSDVEAANAFRFRVRDDANEEIKAAHRYSVLGFGCWFQLSVLFCHDYILILACRELFAMERRLLQLQSESSESIRQLSDEINHLQEDKAYLEERLKIAISSMAPLRSMASSSSPPSMFSLSNEPDSKHSTRRDDRRGGHSSPNSLSHSDDREGSPHSDGGGKFSRHALLALERRAALAEAGLKQAELRQAAAAETHASLLLAANSAKDDEAAAREEAQRELHAVSESKRQLMLQVTSFLIYPCCNIHAHAASFPFS